MNYKLLPLVLSLLAGVSLVGCASPPVGSSFTATEPRSGHALAYVYVRPTSTYTDANPTFLYLNNKNIAKLNEGNYIALQIPAGEQELAAHREMAVIYSDGFKQKIRGEFKAGMVYYFEVRGSTAYADGFSQVEEDTAKAELPYMLYNADWDYRTRLATQNEVAITPVPPVSN